MAALLADVKVAMRAPLWDSRTAVLMAEKLVKSWVAQMAAKRAVSMAALLAEWTADW